MLKLYKRAPDGTHFWEAWEAGNWIVIHEGRLGKRGNVRHVPLAMARPADTVIAEWADDPQSQGFDEIPPEQHYQVVVQYRLKTWGDGADLDKGHTIESLFNQCLGWTGNGHCDGNDIGGGSLNIFSIVVDPDIAVKTMVAALRTYDFLEGAVVAIRYGEEYRVLHPPDFEGEFSLL